MGRVVSSKSASIKNTEVVSIQPPPPVANIPSAPEGTILGAVTVNRGLQPKAPELAVMGAVVQELKRFTDYTEVFGKTSPPHPNVLQTFDVASQWSAMRKKVADWDEYVRMQESLAWQYVRRYADRMQPAFELASKNDESVGARYPALERFFAAASGIAHKAVATRKANQTLVEEGKMPFKGGVGKRRKRSAANKALDEKLAAADKAASASQPTSTVSNAAPPTKEAAPTNGAPPAVNVPNVGST